MPSHRPSPSSVTSPASCSVAAQALCHGSIETSVFAVARSSVRPGDRAHIGIKFGRVLIYLEDRAALESLVGAVDQAAGMADAAFGPVPDAFTEAEAEGRRRFERTGDASQLG